MSRFTTNITTKKKNRLNNADIAITILSAGVGSRIKSYEPRSILKIGSKTLLEHQLETINRCFSGPEIICVFGYDAQKIIKKFDKIRIIENQLYETTNSSESLRLAINNTNKNGVLFMHGDLLFNVETLNSISYNKSFVLIDNKKMFDVSEVGVTIGANKKASIFSYGLNTKWCQIAFITGKELKIAKAIFNKFENHDKKMLLFELLNKMINLGASFDCIEPTNMKILEIDRIKDIE